MKDFTKKEEILTKTSFNDFVKSKSKSKSNNNKNVVDLVLKTSFSPNCVSNPTKITSFQSSTNTFMNRK